MANQASFSVVTPNYNMGVYLAETIESVLSNLQSGDEYYVIDGGSADNSVEVIRKYERWLTGWVSEKDRGYAHALHKGFARANCVCLCWVNSGDLLLRNALGVARAELAIAGTEMIFGDDVYVDECNKVIFKSSGRASSLKRMMLFGGWTPLQDACFWHRSLYERVGGINPDLPYAADYDLFLRFATRGNCRYVPAIFSAFRRHAGQKSIVDGAHYSEERETCRARELGSLRTKLFLPAMLRLYYRTHVRLRYRLATYVRWRSPLLGVDATSLSTHGCH